MARNIFNSVMLPKVGVNRFDLSHDVKMSMQMGWLTPTCIQEVVPGDKFRISVENMLRFAPLISPVMHRVNVTTHYFFVPNRILWPEWEKWITGDSDVDAPYVNLPADGSGGIGDESLATYLGYNAPQNGVAMQVLPVSPLPVAAYVKIWDEYYRDQNLQTERFVELVPGNNTTAYLPILATTPYRRAWQHDYFTSALPFAQKGDAVQIPLAFGSVPVEVTVPSAGVPGVFKDVSGSPMGAGAVTSQGPDLQVGGTDAVYDPNGTLSVDIQADATSVNDLRRAFRLQEWLERNARGGTRYIENILAHFGVRSSDARLQRPEYIGGAFQRMTISEVLSTAQTDSDAGAVITPVGQMAGHGISVGSGKTFNYRAEEHGFIIGVINVQPLTAYQDGLHRMYTRFDRLDYFWPSFANIGEQEVKLKEIWLGETLDIEELEATFGYVPRYAEYKFANSRVAGEMKSGLDFWHLGRKFGLSAADKPVLNDSFIECDPSERIFAVESEDFSHKIYAHIFNNISAVRKMPKFGIPTI